MKWLCKKDFKMNHDNRVVFTAGKTYEEVSRIKHDKWVDIFLIDDEGERHGMDLIEDMLNYFKEE